MKYKTTKSFLRTEFDNLHKKLDTMNKLLTDLQAANADLHKQVTDIGTRVTNDLAALEKKLSDFTSNSLLMTNEDQASLEAEVARIKTDASALSSIDAPVTDNATK